MEGGNEDARINPWVPPEQNMNHSKRNNKKEEANTSLLDTLMLYLDSGVGNTDELEMAKKAIMRDFVNRHHKWAISQMVRASGYKKDKWKTYIAVDGKRKELIKNTEDELIEALYEYYKSTERKARRFKEVFAQLCRHKTDYLGRSEHTVYIDRQRFRKLSPTLQAMEISQISAEDIQKWLVKSFLPTGPSQDSFIKLCQLLGQIFDYGIKKGYCLLNPMKMISARDYLWKCTYDIRPEEEQQFSEEELKLISEEVKKRLNNVHALMILVSIETGMRVGELAALHKKDVGENYIHVHRQQLRGTDESGRERIYEVSYTKEERMHPSGGRKIPITNECREALKLAGMLPGESEYLFHDSKGNMVKKSSYEQYLRRLCRKLGTSATHNHAFRRAFNARLIRLGFEAADRALILGHDVVTNEKNYSITDKRRLDTIRERLLAG